MFTHPLKKKILKRIDDKINDAVQEHEHVKGQMDAEFAGQLNALTNAHLGRIERLEEDTLNRF